MFNKFLPYYFLLLLLFGSLRSKAQQMIEVSYSFEQSISQEKKALLKLKTNFTTLTEYNTYLQRLPSFLHSKGYIEASIDTVIVKANNYSVSIFLGKQYIWQQLNMNASDKVILQNLGFKVATLPKSVFNPTEVTNIVSKLLEYYENNGHPFAAIYFDSIQIDNNSITGILKSELGILYKMDSIRITGSLRLNKNVLYKHLQLTPGSVYQKNKLQQIDKKLSSLPYLQTLQSTQLSMLGTSFITEIYADNKKSNQVDALIGLLPDNAQIGGKLLLTVDAKLNLQNALNGGESIALYWQQIQPQSPRLNIAFGKPYIFNSNFGFDFNFDLFKRDSSFLNLATSIGINYGLGNNQNVKLLYQINQTNLLEIDTNNIKLTKQLPDVIDVVVNSLAVEYNFNNTNYIFNPRTGNEIILTVLAGSRRIKPNNTITSLKDPFFNYTNLYNNLLTTTYLLKSKLKAAHYFAVGKSSTIKTAINAGIVQAPNIFRNEMFQIGGFKLLRGFDEESIFTDKYAIATAEYRFLFSNNSYFNIFSDGGISYNSLQQKTYNYISFGTGLALETKQGILNLAIAAGKRNDLPFSLRQAKIHIGFVSLF